MLTPKKYKEIKIKELKMYSSIILKKYGIVYINYIYFNNIIRKLMSKDG